MVVTDGFIITNKTLCVVVPFVMFLSPPSVSLLAAFSSFICVSKRPVLSAGKYAVLFNNKQTAGHYHSLPNDYLVFMLTKRVTTFNCRKILLKCDIVQRLFRSGP